MPTAAYKDHTRTVLSTAVFGLIADAVNGTFLAAVGTVSIFLCCLAYYREFRKPAAK